MVNALEATRTTSSSNSSNNSTLSALAKRPFTRIKVVAVGASCTGKSCLIKRYCEKKFVPRYISTIGLDYGVRVLTVAGRPVRVNLFDLSGSSDYRQLQHEFLQETQALLACYDVQSAQSFAALEPWIARVQAAMSPECKARLVVCVVGTMANESAALLDTEDDDQGLSSRRKRAVSTDEGAAMAQRMGALFYECSAKTGQNVDACFSELFQRTLEAVDSR